MENMPEERIKYDNQVYSLVESIFFLTLSPSFAKRCQAYRGSR